MELELPLYLLLLRLCLHRLHLLLLLRTGKFDQWLLLRSPCRKVKLEEQTLLKHRSRKCCNFGSHFLHLIVEQSKQSKSLEDLMLRPTQVFLVFQAMMKQ
jgi:hypothetical protein